MKKNKAVFLDRDGIVCKALHPNDGKNGYLIAWEEFRLTSGIKELIDVARNRGYKIFVVTNQPQVAKNLLSIQKLEEIHSKMEAVLGGTIDHVYFCPHKEGDGCECRKPNPGMIHKAEEEYNLDLSKSLIIGDSDKDIEAGKQVGCKTIFVKNKIKEKYLKNCSPDNVVENLREIIPFL